MEPTNKNNAIDVMLSSLFGRDRCTTITEGHCMTCDKTGIVSASFSDDLSRKEYAISGMCQSCQDDFFGVGVPDDDEWPDEEPPEMSDVEADADTLASAGWGTDEDYGYSGDLDNF